VLKQKGKDWGSLEINRNLKTSG